MRKHCNMVVSFTLLGCLLILSCEKEQRSQNQEISKTEEQLNTFHNKSSVQETILIFRSLSNQEKSDVWRMHLELCKQHHAFDQQQLDLIEVMSELVSPEFYANPEPIYESQAYADFKAQIASHFSTEHQKLLMNDLGFYPGNSGTALAEIANGNALEHINNGGSDSGNNNCRCSIKQDWCGVFDPLRPQYCAQVKCNKLKSGCGDFLGAQCTGICKLY